MKVLIVGVIVAGALLAGCAKPEDHGPRVRKECESLAAAFADVRKEAGREVSEDNQRGLVQGCIMARLEGRGR